MNVQLTVVRQVVVDNQRNLLNIDTSGPHICWNQHPTAEKKEQFKWSLVITLVKLDNNNTIIVFNVYQGKQNQTNTMSVGTENLTSVQIGTLS